MPLHQTPVQSVDMLVGGRRKNLAESGKTGRHHEGISIVSAGMKDLVLGDSVHRLLASCIGRQGKSAADGFGEADQIWLHVEILASATSSQLGAGLHLIEDQERSISRAE